MRLPCALRKAAGFGLLSARMENERLPTGLRIYSLASANGQVRADVVPELGGTVAALFLPGPDGRPRECLYRHAWFWDPHTEHTRGGIPLLFPVCGRLLKDGTPGLYHIAGQPFVLPIHGFAMRQPWQVVESSRPDALRLRLADSAQTRAMFPFAFELDALFCVSADGFAIRLTVTNTGPGPMPYYAGFHPYFSTPAPGAGKEQTLFEAHPQARHLYNPTKTDVVGSAPAPSFPMPVAQVDVNELLLDVGTRGDSRLLFSDGFAIRQTASELFRYRQFYTLPNEPFFCDEPWMAPPGSLNRPGAARTLPPGQSESGTVAFAAAGA
jgi:galactose mutarotase-like enzyme